VVFKGEPLEIGTMVFTGWIAFSQPSNTIIINVGNNIQNNKTHMCPAYSVRAGSA